MTKSELIEKVVRNRSLPPDVTKKRVAEILDLAFEELAGYFARSRVTRTSTPRFTFPGFGTFTKKRRSARRGVNPRTLEPMQIEAQLTLDFKPASALREAMNSSRGPRSKTRSKPDPKSTERASRTKRPKSKAKSLAPPAKPLNLRDRRLTTRDEAELDASLDDVLELPSPRLARAERGTKKPLSRNG
ncbi:MAG: HU family DNA-binding protein [Myxococcales bacterium FL481]|nr:MAG: HU family DNA-binding protein [Myxococcales bacterium FL481]